MSFESNIFVLFVLICLSALFSGMETALMAVGRVKVNSLLEQKRQGSKALSRIKEKPSRMIIAILIGNNIVNISAASFATIVAIDLFGSSAVGIATGVMTFLILVFGEIVPKTFAAQNAVRVSLVLARPLEIFMKILTPLIWFFAVITGFVNRISGNKVPEKFSEDDLKSFLMMGRKEGVLDKGEAEMMHNILEFKDTKVDEVMTPEDEVEMIDGDKKISEVLEFIVKSPFSRYPVYLKDRENIVGVVDVDEVLRALHDKKTSKKIKSISKNVLFIPESKDVDDLLTELEERNEKVALVVSEYGDVVGLVSVDDILEEIVGDVFDKSKRRSAYLKKINEKLFKARAKIPLDELNRIFDINIKSDVSNTLGGYMQEKLQKIPEIGERVKYRRFVFEVEKVSRRGIDLVKIIRV